MVTFQKKSAPVTVWFSRYMQ